MGVKLISRQKTRSLRPSPATDNIGHNMSSQTQSERTYFMIKPDGVTRGLIGEIIHRVEQRGLKIIALQMVQPTKAQMDEHYPKDEAWITRIGGKTLSTNEKYHIDTMAQMGTTDPFEIGKRVRGWLIDFMASAPVVKVVSDGRHPRRLLGGLGGHGQPRGPGGAEPGARLGNAGGSRARNQPLVRAGGRPSLPPDWGVIRRW